MQGYNAQAVAATEQIIVAGDITQQCNDSGQLELMIHQAVETLATARCQDRIGTVLADGGCWNNTLMPFLSRRAQDERRHRFGDGP